ncbi:MAG: transcriptional repressor [Deltaproteobacteria bacterium]|nr:transcriptional repressor [Deltaproteobacteria bacterium]MBW2048561.1 transcriptional repressor [Deltaproteobacteria bacterium]
MKQSDHLEKANFSALIETDGNDRIQDRLDIIEVFLETEAHVTLEEMVHLLREKGHDFEPQFVQQCMNRMVDLGFAQKKRFQGQPIRYEHLHLGKHHDHLICTRCGKIVEFEDETMETLQVEIAARYGFHMLQHRMEIYGLCSRCLSRRTPLIPLTMAKPGERVVIREIAGGRKRQARLADMGLRPGDTLEIINNTGRGRIILGRGFTRLAMGRGLAEKIVVFSVPEGEQGH